MNRRELLINLIDERFEGNQALFARSIKRAPAQINQWTKGLRNIGDAGARHIELTLNLPVGFFDKGARPALEASHLKPFSTNMGGIDNGVSIPLLNATASMGQGNDLVYEGDQIIGLMPLSKEWIHRNIKAPPDALRVITGAGDSMEPTFGSGDMLLVDTSKTVIDIDGVYVLSAHNRLFIKRVRQRMSGDFEISSDNPTVKTVDILNGDNPVTVHGRVVWAWNGRSM